MPISWLHLSDVHECNKEKYHRVAMYEAIVAEVKTNPQKPDFVFFTGDLAFSGAADEYKLLRERLLTPLRSVLPASCAIFTVPGNHDVDRRRVLKPRLWIDDEEERTAFQKVGAEGQRKRSDALLPRFEAYRVLEQEFSAWGQDWLGSEQGSVCNVMTVDGQRIAIVGINTAWLCQDDEDWGRLTAGRTMVDAALRQAEAALPDLLLVLGHHPLAAMMGEKEWSDGDRIRQRLERTNAIYLHGHLHASGGQRTGDSMQSALALQAPSGFQAADSKVWRNGLLWGTADTHAGQLTVTPKRWNDTHGEYVFDSDAAAPRFRVASRDSFSFQLPGHTLPLPASAALNRPAKAPARIADIDDNLPTLPPAFHYVRKPYVERQGFAGRATELALIDQWASGTDAMLLFQAIGGMGKSMLTWHWLRTRATDVREDWAGRLWYSFYEQGADLNDFCVQALAYIRHESPKAFRGRRTLDLGDELRRELDTRPWLLILDGLERVLVAYNRAGKGHMTDEEAVVVRDDMGLDREPRDCFRPEDDDVLAMLAQASRGKLLASSRLTPIALMNESRQPIPGVMRVALEGLVPEDGELVLRNAGVIGDGWRMRRFLADNFDGHPLSVGAVAGQVMTFLEARGDFDRWMEHPRGGADPALIAKNLRGRQNHILSRAFDDLEDDAKALLGSIAMSNIELTLDVLRILNPKRPIEPKKIRRPREIEDADYLDRKHWSLKHDRDHAQTDEARAAAQEKLDTYRKQDLAKQTERYDAYIAALPAWQQKADDADAWLEQILPVLEARGLLQYDAAAGSLDMHPAIRHTALLGLSQDARSSTGSHVSDALSSRPAKPLEQARTRDDLTLAMTRVEALNAAGKLEDGWSLFRQSDLDDALSRLNYFHEQLELLQPYFTQGWEHGPTLLPEHMRADALGLAATSLSQTGKPQLSCALYNKAIRMRLREETLTAASLGNLAIGLEVQGRLAPATRLDSLAIRLAEAQGDNDILLWLKYNQAGRHLDCGQIDEAEATLVTLRETFRHEKVSAENEAQILACDLNLAFRAGSLSEQIAEDCLKRIRSLGGRFFERVSLHIIAIWRQSCGRHDDALNTFGDLIALANEIGSPMLPVYEAQRALSLAARGRQDEARRIAAKVDRGKDRPHVSLALLYLEFADSAKARMHAIAGYKEAWSEGPPYHNHWDLEHCRKVLAAIGDPEPLLPPFDSSKVEPFDFELDVERLIEKILAEKAEEDAKMAKREAAHQAEATKNANTPKQH
jgi:predicted phosphodiesterase